MAVSLTVIKAGYHQMFILSQQSRQDGLDFAKQRTNVLARLMIRGGANDPEKYIDCIHRLNQNLSMIVNEEAPPPGTVEDKPQKAIYVLTAANFWKAKAAMMPRPW